jgi:hypothetical protein
MNQSPWAIVGIILGFIALAGVVWYCCPPTTTNAHPTFQL